MKSFKQYISESNFKHPYHVTPVKNRSAEAKEALSHSDRRVHHLTMHERLHTKAEKEKNVAKKEQLFDAADKHRKAMSAHHSAEHHILHALHIKRPEQFSSPPDLPKNHKSSHEAKTAAHEASEAARVASAVDNHSTYTGKHAAFVKSYPKL